MNNAGKIKIFLARNGIYVALILLIAFFTFVNSNFLSFGNAQNILLQAVELGLIALPLALLVMSGSVDLSVGSVASSGAVTAGIVMGATGSPWLGTWFGAWLAGRSDKRLPGLLSRPEPNRRHLGLPERLGRIRAADHRRQNDQ